jgi:hypothetical protein
MQHDMDSAELEDAYNECRPPARVEDTDTYWDDAEGARRLWADGFRAMHAHDLKHHDQVAYVETMFEMSTNRHGVTTVEEVANDGYGTIIVSTWDRGTINCDECTEVWVRRASA